VNLQIFAEIIANNLKGMYLFSILFLSVNVAIFSALVFLSIKGEK
jgi:hypothetical protein